MLSLKAVPPFLSLSFLISHLGNSISDLGSNIDPSTLDAEAAGHWTISNEACPACSRSTSMSVSCYYPPTQILFGGPNILGPTSGSTAGEYFEFYVSLGPNTFTNLGFNFHFWVVSQVSITSMTMNDVADFTVNGDDLGYSSSGTYSSGCEANYTMNNGVTVTGATLYSGEIQHISPFNSANSIAFRVKSKLGVPSTETSFGLRSFSMYLLDTPYYGTVNFPCDTSYFWDTTTCSACHQYCSTCSGPTNDECSACVYPNYNYGNQTCSPYCPTTGPLNASTSSGTYNSCRFKCGTGFYWAYNDSCTATCNSPLVKTMGTLSNNWVNSCGSPCPSQYFYPDGTCTTTCNSKWESVVEELNVIQYCRNPCGTSGFMYPDATCNNTCPTPLLTQTEHDMTFCYTPCQSGEYLYPNSSCFTTCDLPLLQYTDNMSISFCKDPCGSNEFLYPDGSCNSTCPSPLLSRTEPDVEYCFTPCGTNEYLFPNGSCIGVCYQPWIAIEEPSKNFKFCTNPCDILGATPYLYPDSTCGTCPSPLTSSSEPDVKYCLTPCQSSLHLYANGSCLSECNAPLIPTEDPSWSIRSCINPCNSTAYLYPDSSCNSACPSPLLSRTEPDVKYCFTPCQSDEYLYVNGTCSVRCESPLLKKEETNTFKSCVNPCQPADSLFLFPDSSCNSTCSSPLFERTEPGVKYCYNPCGGNNTFLSELQVCQKTCPYPSISKDVSYAKYCNFPCKNWEHYYNMVDKKCEATCAYPYTATESPLPKLCGSSLSDEDRKQVEQMANAADSANSAASTGNLIWGLISSGDSTAACMGPLAKMLQYIKFMDIVYPEKVQLMLLEQTKKTNKKGFTQKMMGSALDSFPNHELTGKFHVYPINSSFFVNFWPSLFNLSVILVVTGLVIGLTASTKGNAKINGILKSVSDVLKWNVFLVQFCGMIGDIVLYTALEFQAMQFENAAEVISFILCLGINTLVVIVVVKILDVNTAIRRAKKGKLEEEQKKMIEKEWSSYKALFEVYKDYSFYQQIFLFVFIMRLVIFNATIGYLYKYPLFQASITMMTNLLMFGYLVIKRPMKKIVPLIQQIVLELVLLPFNACVLILAIMDNQEILESDYRKAIGNVIFYINVMVPILSMVLMAAKFIAMAVDLYKTWRLSKLKKPVVNQVKLRNQPMSLETPGNKSFTTTENPYNSTQILDVTDNSMMMMMVPPEMNMTRLNSRIESSPVHPRTRHKRPQMRRNFLTPDHQNMFQKSSMLQDHQDTFPQQVPSDVDRTPSVLELHNNEYNNDQSIQRSKARIWRSGRSRLQLDDELIW